MPTFQGSHRAAMDNPTLTNKPNQSALTRKRVTACFPPYVIGGTETTNDVVELGPLGIAAARFLEARVRLPAHATAFINAAGKIGKKVKVAQTPVAGNWTRSTTTATVTTATRHGLISGQTLIAITASSSVAAIVNGNVTVTVTSPYTFTFTCLNAGDASGTLKFAEGVGSIGYFTAAANVQSASSGTAAGAGTTVTFAPTAGEVFQMNPSDDVIFTFTGATDIDAGRELDIEVDVAAQP